jgi:hypothetical protein
MPQPSAHPLDICLTSRLCGPFFMELQAGGVRAEAELELREHVHDRSRRGSEADQSQWGTLRNRVLRVNT